jgi:hypothetical protein
MTPWSNLQHCRTRAQWRLHDIAYFILVLALASANLTPAARSGGHLDWAATGLVFTLFGLLFCPVLLIGLVIRFSPTSLDAERAAVGLVLKTALVLIMVAMALVIHAR